VALRPKAGRRGARPAASKTSGRASARPNIDSSLFPETTLSTDVGLAAAGSQAGPAEHTIRQWRQIFAKYQKPRTGRSLFELAVSAGGFFGLWAALTWTVGSGYWIALLLCLPAAAFLLRLFMIQHDCGHGAFFPRRRLNDVVGRVIGVLTMTPYAYWRRSHALHHAGSGNLERRGDGDIETLTVEEYRRKSPWRRRFYRIARHPAVMLGLGPIYLFVLKNRLPIEAPAGRRREAWLSVMGTNLGITALVLIALFGLGLGYIELLAIQGLIITLAGAAGIWLFYVQHQFEDTYWRHDDEWRFHDAAFHGSSFYDLPPVLTWFTANIGVHHVHHLAARIPSYRLKEVLRDHPELARVNRLTLRQSLACFRLKLWDEDQKRLVPIAEVA